MSSTEPQKSGFIGNIPVRNLWLLMLYASEFRRVKGNRFTDLENKPDDIPDLVAKVLCEQVDLRLKYGNLGIGYIVKEEILSCIRGRIDFLKTERNQLLKSGKIACRFDDMTVDIPRNRFVRDALFAVSRIVNEPDIKRKCLVLNQKFKLLGVTGENLNPIREFETQFGRHDIEDRPMVDAANLAVNISLPNESDGSKFLPNFDKREEWVRVLFEKGVRGFYNYKLKDQGWKVNEFKNINWKFENESPGAKKIIPRMEIDIMLESNDCRIIIDTKFKSILKKNRFNEDKLRSGDIFQLFAYLKSQESELEISKNAKGILLYPSTSIGEDIFEHATIQNHKIGFATVDLSKSSKYIKDRLLKLIDL